MRHVTTLRLAVAALCIGLLQAFASGLTALYRETIPAPIYLLTGTAVVVLVTVAATVALVDHRNVDHRRQLAAAVTAEVKHLLAEYHRDQAMVTDVAVSNIVKAMTTHLANIRDDVADLTSTQRFTRIIGEQVKPIMQAEALQAWHDLQRLEELQALDGQTEGPSNVRPMRVTPDRDGR